MYKDFAMLQDTSLLFSHRPFFPFAGGFAAGLGLKKLS